MNRLHVFVAIGALAVTLAGLFVLAMVSQPDSSECRKIAAEQNRWEFCPPLPIPAMTLSVAKTNNSTSDLQSSSQRLSHEHTDNLGMDCATIDDCHLVARSRAIRPIDNTIITVSPARPDLTLQMEGEMLPTNITIQIQSFVPSRKDTSSIANLNSIADTHLSLAKEEERPGFYRYRTDALPDGYFILNVISEWDEDTLAQDLEIFTLHQFKIIIPTQ